MNNGNTCEIYLAVVVAEETANIAVKTLNERIKSGDFGKQFSSHYSRMNELPYVQVNVTGIFTLEPWSVQKKQKRE